MPQPEWRIPLKCFPGFRDLRGLLAGELVADGDVHRGSMEVLHAQAHRGFVQELVRDGPGAFGRAVLGGHDVEWPRDFWMPESTGAPLSPVSAPRSQW